MSRILEQADLEAAFAAAAAAVRSGDPDVLAGRVRPLSAVTKLRQRLGLRQNEFAERYHIPLATLEAWEGGKVEPDAVANALLALIAAEPEEVARMLAEATPAAAE